MKLITLHKPILFIVRSKARLQLDFKYLTIIKQEFQEQEWGFRRGEGMGVRLGDGRTVGRLRGRGKSVS